MWLRNLENKFTPFSSYCLAMMHTYLYCMGDIGIIIYTIYVQCTLFTYVTIVWCWLSNFSKKKFSHPNKIEEPNAYVFIAIYLPLMKLLVDFLSFCNPPRRRRVLKNYAFQPWQTYDVWVFSIWILIYMEQWLSIDPNIQKLFCNDDDDDVRSTKSIEW